MQGATQHAEDTREQAAVPGLAEVRQDVSIPRLHWLGLSHGGYHTVLPPFRGSVQCVINRRTFRHGSTHSTRSFLLFLSQVPLEKAIVDCKYLIGTDYLIIATTIHNHFVFHMTSANLTDFHVYCYLRCFVCRRYHGDVHRFSKFSPGVIRCCLRVMFIRWNLFRYVFVFMASMGEFYNSVVNISSSALSQVV